MTPIADVTPSEEMQGRKGDHSLIAQHDEQIAEGSSNLQAPAEAVEAQRRGRGPAPLLALSGNHQPRACCHAPAAAGLRQIWHTHGQLCILQALLTPSLLVMSVKHLQGDVQDPAVRLHS